MAPGGTFVSSWYDLNWLISANLTIEEVEVGPGRILSTTKDAGSDRETEFSSTPVEKFIG